MTVKLKNLPRIRWRLKTDTAFRVSPLTVYPLTAEQRTRLSSSGVRVRPVLP